MEVSIGGRYDPIFVHSFFFLVFLLFVCTYADGQTQTEIMRNLSQIISSSSSNGRWNSTSPNPCNWNGVNCSSSSSSSVVTRLDFSSIGLCNANQTSVSLFFELLCRLDSLRSLDLSANFLTSIPAPFFSNCSGLSKLMSLDLSFNRLGGPLPNFSSFRALEMLNVSYNNFNGSIVSQLDGLTGLKSLILSMNSLSGSIPTVGKKLLELEELVLSGNNFTGDVPPEIAHYKKLTFLDLSQNNLAGPIPKSITELSKLETLLLSSNAFMGEIPGNLSKIRTLSRFSAHVNQLNGTIPPEITESLEVLGLSYNKLTGKIPPDLLSSANLQSVDLTGNQLKGPIPSRLSPRLFRLLLGGNLLSGSIPEDVRLLSNLTYLELNDNKLNSHIPPSIGDCKNLTLLNLGSNKLHGSLPKNMGNLEQLIVLKLENNNLAGQIPTELYRLVKLNTLNLSDNSFTGTISSMIANFTKLTYLHLQDNQFYGSIPNMTCNLVQLIDLNLGRNNFNGTVPKMPMKLEFLNLGGNSLSGSITSEFGDLSQLEILDLSDNDFVGEIPGFLNKMSSLTLLNLSDNQLSGIVPVFPNYVEVFLSGNKNIIYSNETSEMPAPKKKMSIPLIILVVIISSVSVLSFVAIVFMWMYSRRFYRVEDEGPLSIKNPQIVTGCIVSASSIHISSIDLSSAMEAVTNPGNVILKTRFSTYYKTVMPSGVSYSIKRLNWSGKIFQMGSYEKFRNALEMLGKLSNSNVMVPLAYVLTEGDAYLFYEHVHIGTLFDFLHKDPKSSLDWASRYSIALGVAQGLTFLHGCTEPVLLLDLSTKTVHLKSLKEPQIGDIELCKVMDPSKSTRSLSTVAGSVGYIPPEYAYTMRVTMAGNIYSFGVLLLELLTGKEPVSNGIELANWALSCSARIEHRERILDSSISRTSLAVRSQMLSVLKVALACVSVSPEARPRTRNVLRMLFNAR